MNNTYLGNFVINESNIEQYDNGFYRLKHMDTLLLMRDKVLNRGKRLFAKIQSCNINKCTLSGKMTVRFYKASFVIWDETIQQDYNLTFNPYENDLINKINIILRQLYETDKKNILNIKFEYDSNYQININVTEWNSIVYIKFIFDSVLAEYLGFDANKEFMCGNAQNSYTAPRPAIQNITAIYFYHPNLMHSNLNKDSITAISHPGPDQLIYDNQFEISSLTPNVNVEFFIYHRDKIDGEYRVIKKRIKPVSLCIVIGLYEDF